MKGGWHGYADEWGEWLKGWGEEAAIAMGEENLEEDGFAREGVKRGDGV